MVLIVNMYPVAYVHFRIPFGSAIVCTESFLRLRSYVLMQVYILVNLWLRFVW